MNNAAETTYRVDHAAEDQVNPRLHSEHLLASFSNHAQHTVGDRKATNDVDVASRAKKARRPDTAAFPPSNATFAPMRRRRC